MNKEYYLNKICKCIDNSMVQEYETILDELVSYDDKEVSQLIADAFVQQYTSMKADVLAFYMEKAIRKNLNWAYILDDENPLFKTAIFKGSMDLYDCYMETVPKPYNGWYSKLLNKSSQIFVVIYNNYKSVIKGRDFNGEVPQDGGLYLDKEDFDIMDHVVELFNGFVGRRDILYDLKKKSDTEH